MKVRIFRNMRGVEHTSMKIYADALEKYLGLDCVGFSVPCLRYPRALYYFVKECFYPAAVIGQQGDINHIVDHSYGSLLRFLDPRRTVVTCHDLISLEYPGNASVPGRALFRYNAGFLKKAARIVAVSEYTRTKLVEYLGIVPQKIRVVPQGVDGRFRSPVPVETLRGFQRRYGLDTGDPYVVHIGVGVPYKNVGLILSALARFDGIRLVKVGDFRGEELKRIERDGLAGRVVHIPKLPVEDLAALYRSAVCLVFPSLYEGFGWPVLEAMASGCPVVCSRRASLPEVGGGAPLYLDRLDSDELVDAVTRVAASSALRDEMRQKGLEQSRKFSWEKAIRKIRSVYDEVAAESGEGAR